MNATKLIERLCYDSSLAEKGDTMTMNVTNESGLDAYCTGYFGTEGGWVGQRIPGATYFYLYIELDDLDYIYRLMGSYPDAMSVRTEEKDVVALWRVE